MLNLLHTVVVWLYDCTTVRLYDCTTVRLYDCTTVRLYDCTTVRLYDCTTVRLYDCTTVRLYDCTTVRLYDCTTVWLYNCTLVWPCDHVTMWPCDRATVRPYDCMTVWLYGCMMEDNTFNMLDILVNIVYVCSVSREQLSHSLGPCRFYQFGCCIYWSVKKRVDPTNVLLDQQLNTIFTVSFTKSIFAELNTTPVSVVCCTWGSQSDRWAVWLKQGPVCWQWSHQPAPPVCKTTYQ